MSFIYPEKKGETYAPGWFLANNEECVRLTKQFAADSALVVSENSTKHVPMGTAYPTNDGNAIGIVYEDVDMTSGNMPGSVVMSGTVYENRLAITGAQYDSVTLKNLVSPKDQGWQERSGAGTEQSPYVYTDSTDTTVNTSKTYYLDDDDHTAVSDYAAVLNPKEEGWYERSGSSPNYVYTPSTDTAGDKTKTYYEKSDIRLASAAKSALEGKGFVFLNEGSVTRPY
jgi:hypothetical protein